MKNLITAIFVVITAGCYHSSTVKTPVGTEKNRMYALGIVSTSNVDTDTNFKRCRDLLKPGHQLDASMIDREVYDKCFADHMQSVQPGQGQQPAPTPMDVNGDGRPDFFQYNDGYQVPTNLYQMYPGMYWPGVYQQFGYGPGDFAYGPAPMSYQQYAPVGPMSYAPVMPGPSFNQGTALDPVTTYYTLQQVGYPVEEQDYVTRGETISRQEGRALKHQIDKNARRGAENSAAISQQPAVEERSADDE